MLAQPLTKVTYDTPRPTITYAGYRHVQSSALGVIQIIIGSLCILINAIAIAFGDDFGSIGHGFWNGIIYIVAGSLGVAAAKNKTKCTIISFMVMCISSAVMTISLLTLGLYGIDNSSVAKGFLCENPFTVTIECSKKNIGLVMEALLVTLALIEAILAIWGSVVCCQAVCCCSSVGVHPADGMPQWGYPNQIVFVPYHQQMQSGSQQPNQSIPAQYWNEQQGRFTMASDGSYLNNYPPPQMTTANQALDPSVYRTSIGQNNMPNIDPSANVGPIPSRHAS